MIPKVLSLIGRSPEHPDAKINQESRAGSLHNVDWREIFVSKYENEYCLLARRLGEREIPSFENDIHINVKKK